MIKDFLTKVSDPSSEMEFFETNLTRVFCSMLFTVPFTRGFSRKIYSTLVLISLQKIHQQFVENEGQKPDKNSCLRRRLEFMSRNLDKIWRSRIPSLVSLLNKVHNLFLLIYRSNANCLKNCGKNWIKVSECVRGTMFAWLTMASMSPWKNMSPISGQGCRVSSFGSYVNSAFM